MWQLCLGASLRLGVLGFAVLRARYHFCRHDEERDTGLARNRERDAPQHKARQSVATTAAHHERAAWLRFRERRKSLQPEYPGDRTWFAPKRSPLAPAACAGCSDTRGNLTHLGV